MADIFDKCVSFARQRQAFSPNEQRMAAGLFSSPSPPGNAGPWTHGDGRDMLQFASNDYLGLASHPDIRAAAAEVAAQYGIGAPMGSRLLTGTTAEHLALEAELAAFKLHEASVVFPAGAMAMMGMLAALADRRDVLLLDEYAHHTLAMGAKLSGAEIHYFRHNDVAHLESILEHHLRDRSGAIIVDGVYSMQGDVAPLPELVELKKEYGVRLFVDDAHGNGVWGEHGRGTSSHFGLEHYIDLEMGTFSKALGTIGGFVAGDRSVIDYLRYTAPTLVFTKSLPLAVVVATRKALELVRAADDRRSALWRNRDWLQKRLVECGFSLGRTQTAITPIRCANNDALHIAFELRQTCGIWVAPVVYPAVPMGESMLRVIPTAAHSQADLELLVKNLVEVRASMVLGALGAGWLGKFGARQSMAEPV
jgi:8-amino-7-oxononanoate synthase